jgi:hypothetical protein
VNSAAKRDDAQLLHAPHFYTRRLNRRRLQKGRAELTDVSDVIEAFWHRADTAANGHSMSDSDDDAALDDETVIDETDGDVTDDNPFVAARTSSSGSRSGSSSPYRAPLYVNSNSNSNSTATTVTTNTTSSSAGTAATSVDSSSGGLRHPLDIDAAENGNIDSNNRSSNGATAAAGFSANIHYDYFHRSNSTSNDTRVIDKRRDRTAGARGRLAPELVAQLPGLYVGHLAEETLPDSDEYGICMTSSGSSSSKSTAASNTTAATAATATANTAASNGLAAPLLNDSDLQQELQVQRRRRLLRRRRAWSSLYWQQWRLRRRMRRGKQCAADAFMSGPLWLRVLRAVEMPFVLARNATVAPVEADSWK